MAGMRTYYLRRSRSHPYIEIKAKNIDELRRKIIKKYGGGSKNQFFFSVMVQVGPKNNRQYKEIGWIWNNPPSPHPKDDCGMDLFYPIGVLWDYKMYGLTRTARVSPKTGKLLERA